MDWDKVIADFYMRFAHVRALCERKHISIEHGMRKKYHILTFHCGERNAAHKQILAEMKFAFPESIMFNQKQKRTVMHVPYTVQ